MANRTNLAPLIVVTALTVILASVGLMLAFGPRHAPRPSDPIPRVPDHGPAIHGMQSVRSDSNRVRLTWRETPGVMGYRVTVFTTQGDSLFASPVLSNNAWVIPRELRDRFEQHTVYHWRLTILKPYGVEHSEPATFATQ